jgi:hypothetical protein
MDVMKYYVGQVGNLPHMSTMRVPVRMIAMVALLLMGIVAYVVFSLWLFGTLSTEIWNASSPLPVFWTRCVVVVSLGLVAASYLMPSDLLVKRSYMHVGLAKMMNRAHEIDRERYLRYLRWVNRLARK